MDHDEDTTRQQDEEPQAGPEQAEAGAGPEQAEAGAGPEQAEAGAGTEQAEAGAGTEQAEAGPQAPPPASEAPPTAGQGARRLMRSRSDRVIGGVCGGLGRYFDVDAVIFRIAAVALVLLAGSGVLLYLAALLLMPSDDGSAGVPSERAPRTEGRNRALVVAGIVLLLLVGWPFLLGGGILLGAIVVPLAVLVVVGVLVWWLVAGEGPSGEAGDVAKRALLGIAVLVACLVLALGGAWAAAAGGDTVVAAIVIGAGAAVLAGAFLRPVRWLILPAVALALAAGTVSAAGLDLDGGVGEREYRPASTVDLRDRYELGVGQLVVDLRDTQLPAGDVPLEVDLGIGDARVLVPDDMCVSTHAEVGMGEVVVLGRGNHGVDVDFEETLPADSEDTRLLLDAEVGLGSLRVTHQNFDDHGFDFGPRDEFDFDDEQNSCDTTAETASG